MIIAVCLYKPITKPKQQSKPACASLMLTLPYGAVVYKCPPLTVCIDASLGMHCINVAPAEHASASGKTWRWTSLCRLRRATWSAPTYLSPSLISLSMYLYIHICIYVLKTNIHTYVATRLCSVCSTTCSC